MSNEALKRLERLEELVKAAKDTGGTWYVWIKNANIKIKNANRTVLEYDAESPLEAVEAIEAHILKKAPGHVNISYHVDDIFSLYPEYRAAFGDFAPVPCSQLTTGDYYDSLGDFTLKHIILYNHVLTWGCETEISKEKGIFYTEDDFQRICRSEVLLFAALLDIIQKEQNWRDTSPDYKPDRPGCSYGNMRYGKTAK